MQTIEGWKYYQYAAIPTTPPHAIVNLKPVEDQSIWKVLHPKIIRWTTDFDCQFPTNWWYVIKDEPFDISQLKSKRRYEINKGNKFFDVFLIDPTTYAAAIFDVANAAFSTYPKSYRPSFNRETFISHVKTWKGKRKVYGAFSKENGRLYGYACLEVNGERCINFTVLKADPIKEKEGINAAIIYKILDDYHDFLADDGYICDGARSIQHQTSFQDYLEKYFLFRKAYCHIHVEYSKDIWFLISICYPFRHIIHNLRHVKQFGRLDALLKMEEIVRERF